jgi:catechol 2,3-dioxygenase-like lactoylglutathione lyase family enzyme
LALRLERLDHLVLTVASIDVTVEFYERVMGMQAITFGEGRRALRFGEQKINLHQVGREFEPRALRPTPGSADLCFISSEPVDALLGELAGLEVAVEIGPVTRSGALGPIRSIYFRDPDGNLIEVAQQLPD